MLDLRKIKLPFHLFVLVVSQLIQLLGYQFFELELRNFLVSLFVRRKFGSLYFLHQFLGFFDLFDSRIGPFSQTLDNLLL